MEKFNWKKKRVLVTGAGGFIGSHLSEHLVELGAKVRALVHYNSLGRWGWLDESDVREDIEVFSGDVRDRDSVAKAAEGQEIIFHLAALIGIPYSYEAAHSYIQTNIVGMLNVLQAAKNVGVERLIHTSTSETYGTAQYVPIDEKHPMQAQSPYSATKVGADKLAESFYRSFDLPLVTIRPFNTYGPRQSSRAIIPTIISQVLSGEQVCIGATEPKRDMNFVKDTVSGFIAAAEAGKEALGEVFNIGSGEEIAIKDLAMLIMELAERKAPIISTPERRRPEKSEVERLLADNAKALKFLGWRPAFTLRKGLELTIDWFLQPGRLKMYRNNHYTI